MSVDDVKEIERLERELREKKARLQIKQRTCRHEFGPTEYDPIVTPRMVFDHFEGHGSDPNPIYKQAGNETKPRWKRVCKLCGKVEYTEKRRVVKSEPDFG